MDELFEIMIWLNASDIASFKSTTYEIQYFIELVEAEKAYWITKLNKRFDYSIEEDYSLEELKELYREVELEEIIKRNDSAVFEKYFEDTKIPLTANVFYKIAEYDADKILETRAGKFWLNLGRVVYERAYLKALENNSYKVEKIMARTNPGNIDTMRFAFRGLYDDFLKNQPA